MGRKITVLVLVAGGLGLWWLSGERSDVPAPEEVVQDSAKDPVPVESSVAEYSAEQSVRVDNDTKPNAEVAPSNDGMGVANPTLDQLDAALAQRDEGFFSRLRADPRCSDCAEIFAKLGEVFSTTTDPELASLVAATLAQSEEARYVQMIVERLNATASDPRMREALVQALEVVTGGDDVAAVLAPLLNSETVDELREAALTGLSGLTVPGAARALIEFARTVGDGKGGYDSADGLGEFIPDPDSYPLLQDVASSRELEAPLAIKALFNGGVEATRIAIDVIASANEEEQARLLAGAQAHVLIEPNTLDYLRSVLKEGQRVSPVLRRFLEEVLARDGRDGANAG